MTAQIDVYFVNCAHFFIPTVFNCQHICSFWIEFVLQRLLILEGITLFWSLEDDFVFHRVFAFQICVRHFAILCLLNLFRQILCFSVVSQLLSRYWTGLKRKWQFFLGIYKHSFSLTAAHSQSLVFSAILWIIPS